MIGPYVELTRAVLERDYIRAHDHYVELAIGNAPWPIVRAPKTFKYP